MIKTDLCHGITAAEKVELLREHLSAARTGHNRPLCIIGVVVFCDRLLFSRPPDSDGLVSIQVLVYVQANSSTPLSTMKKWIDSVTWQPVPGGLMRNNEYMSNMHRFPDPNDDGPGSWRLEVSERIIRDAWRRRQQSGREPCGTLHFGQTQLQILAVTARCCGLSTVLRSCTARCGGVQGRGSNSAAASDSSVSEGLPYYTSHQ
jgi:hypothetical protein